MLSSRSVGIRGAWDWFTKAAAAELAVQGRAALPGPPARPEGTGTPMTIERMIEQALTAREADFSLADALRMPPVIRAKTLLRSTAAQLPVVVYRDGLPIDDQPRIVRRPNAYKTLGDFVGESVDGLVDHGEVFWRLGDYDAEGRPMFATVLPWEEVRVDWAPRLAGLVARYWWNDDELIADREIKHVAINRRPGELRGRGPLTEALPFLAAVDAAETFAAGWFTSGGIPSVVLRTKGPLSEDQSTDLKTKWMTAHNTDVPTPAVLGGGIEDHYPDVDPARSQLQEARSYGATVVARLLGIPGPLLLIETSGSTITYQNATAALGELVKGTLAPTYLSPIEYAWSDLVGGRSRVRFELAELSRADIAGRYAVYGEGIGLGIFSADEARGWEGLPPTAQTVPAALAPIPNPRRIPVSIEGRI